MLLTIDAGNTNTVFALYEGETRRGQWRISTDGQRTADEYAVWLTNLMALESLEAKDIDAAIMAIVVPQATFDLTRLCTKYFNAEPLIVGPSLDLGIRIAIAKPEEVGADRLVNAVAAHKFFGGPAIVIDFGTSTNFDIIDADGAYLGGILAPGVNLSLEALHVAAAKLPHIAVEKPATVIGGGTIPAMQSGVYYGYLGLIEGLVARTIAEFGAPMKVIATGGLASLFADGTETIEEVDADLTMRGLLEIWRRNSGAAQ
jgi:type III pantothenate kinase